METLVLWMVFGVVMAAALVQARVKGNKLRHWQLTPQLMLVASFFLYSSAMPISRIFWRSDATATDIPFMETNILAALGIFAGLYLSRFVSPPGTSQPRAVSAPWPASLCIFTAVAALLAAVAYALYSVGMQVSNLFTPYGFETTVTEAGTLDNLAYVIVNACIIRSYFAALTHPSKSRQLKRVVLLIASLICALMLIRGMRNNVVILILPMIGMSLQNRRLPLMKTLAAVFAGFLIFSVVAAERTFGIAEGRNNDIAVNYDPLGGELGTTFNVYAESDNILSGRELQLGKTYVVGFATNLVPRALWPDRPPSPAVEFSQIYYGTDQLPFGLGYSPVVEAITNFSVYGVPCVFAAASIFVVLLAGYLRRRGGWGTLSYWMMLPMILNWNRIDFSASGKMFLVYVAFFIIIDALVNRPATAAPAARRRALAQFALWSASQESGLRAQVAGPDGGRTRPR